MRLPVLTLVLLGLVSPVASAQTAHLVGRVVDAETRSGLPGVNVFVSGSARGASTEPDGTFAFDTDVLGAVQVAASMLGYTTATHSVYLAAGDTVRIPLTLSAVTDELAEIAIEGSVDRAWRGQFRRFEERFFGASRNGRGAELVNPEVIDFDARGERLNASARQPVVVVNERMGYRMTLHDLQFASDDRTWSWTSPVRYEDLPSADSRRVTRARRDAYNGSLRHFLASLVAGTSRDEGFRVRSPAFPPRRTDIPSYDEDALAAMVSPDGDTGRFVVSSSGTLQVTYLGESDPRPRTNHRREQLSWILIPQSRVEVDARGRVLDGTAIQRLGYWDWERVADLLPSDYIPE